MARRARKYYLGLVTITQDVAETMGVRLSAGTLYAVIARLEGRGLIEPLESDDRRRPYRITMAGAEALAQQYERAARELSELRKTAAERLSKQVERELKSLAMAGTQFQINVGQGAWTASGVNEISFVVSPNRGEELKPLDKIASGGEL